MRRLAVVAAGLAALALLWSVFQPFAGKGGGPVSVTIPKDAVQNADGSYSYTDKQGKKWLYRNTPFGVARSEDKGPKAAGHAYLPPKVRTPLNSSQHPDEPIARASVPEEDRAAIKKVFER